MNAKTLAWVAVGLLAISSAFWLSRNPSLDVNPTVAEKGPGGLSLLAELLRARGYQVITQSPRDDVPTIRLRNNTGEDEPAEESPFLSTLAITFPYSLDEQLTGYEITAMQMLGQDKLLSVRVPMLSVGLGTGIWLARSEGTTWAALRLPKTGREVLVENGVALLNRHLAEEDNAAYALQLVRAANPEARRIYFEAPDQAPSKGFLETFGPWAVPVAWQMLLLFAVLVAVGQRRLGLPQAEIIHRPSQRELVDALGDLYARKRSPADALAVLAGYARTRVRRDTANSLDSTPREEEDAPAAGRRIEATWKDAEAPSDRSHRV